MFKAYKEPPKPAYDWTDMLVEKGIPLLGAAGGAVAGGLIGGPPGIAAGMSLGSGLGNMVSGAISEKPTAEAKMARGMAGAQQGYKDWRELPPEKKLDTNEEGKIPGMSTSDPSKMLKGDDLVNIPMIKPTTEDDLSPNSPFSSSRAGLFAKRSMSGY